MWWQVIPPLLITGVLPASIFVTMPLLTYVFTGRPTERYIAEGTTYDVYAKHGFRRDWDRTGNNYTSIGLDAIPDE